MPIGIAQSGIPPARRFHRPAALLLGVTAFGIGCAQLSPSAPTPLDGSGTVTNASQTSSPRAPAAAKTRIEQPPSARPTPESVGLSSRALARLDRVLEGYVDREQIPGFQLQVARRGRVVHEHVYGEMNRETAEPLRRDAIYRLYSMTKVITGVATLIAYEQGSFLLHEPVSKYLPELENLRVMEWGKKGQTRTVPAEREITILDLLRHTSGFTYNFIAPPPLGQMYVEAGITPGLKPSSRASILGDPKPDNAINLEEMVRRLGQLPLIAQPGSAWNYSVSMDVLGRLIEVTTGRAFDAFLQEEIFEKVGMHDTAFFISDDRLDRFPACYVPTPDAKMVLQDAPITSSYRSRPTLPSGGGGLVGTADDYMRFAQMLLAGGKANGKADVHTDPNVDPQVDRSVDDTAEDQRLLSPRTLQMMMTNQLPEQIFGTQPISVLYGRSFANDSLGVGFGLTGSVIKDAAYTGLPVSTGTFGWGGAASTYFWVDPEEEIAVVFMTQLLGSSTYPLRPHLMKGVGAALLD